MATISRPLPETSYLRQCFRTTKGSGRLIWLERPLCHFDTKIEQLRWNQRYAGKRACKEHGTRVYRYVLLDGVQYRANRICYALYHGKCPVDMEIDHRNRKRDDNSERNLFAVSHETNGRNRGLYASNTTGVTGVSWREDRKRWRALAMGENSKQVHLGYFIEFADAVQARKQWMRTVGVRIGYARNHGV
ncbi:HNH endonuclease signature motif containing protein [Burkholderia sp. SIMBA_043]|uniref:HNH endonuclease signature motif containing protein n=1 Tax=Burkholderia TaxID=32008 RepID=UPI0005D87B94|nr:HNH endonuclease signature motif containing protein [Burkholderia vietnamiensis]AJY05970.1 AP2 domain protein [Burkholderia vietnamiensis LMG 10929]AVR17208.1 HNH endonuclease [Burkholderia vietnamiensis]UBI27555.1 HNH endonuclease [Burkholderia vietnamiensis]